MLVEVRHEKFIARFMYHFPVFHTQLSLRGENLSTFLMHESFFFLPQIELRMEKRLSIPSNLLN